MGRFVDALERRAHPRVKRQLACRVVVANQCRSGVLRDLSAHGLCVELQGALPPGDPVFVSLDSPEGWRFVLVGSARRSRPTPLSLAQLAAGELALSLQDPPPSYLRWLEGTRGGAA
jgi:hypothetical protein